MSAVSPIPKGAPAAMRRIRLLLPLLATALVLLALAPAAHADGGAGDEVACPTAEELAASATSYEKELLTRLLRHAVDGRFEIPTFFMRGNVAGLARVCMPDGADAAFDVETGVIAVADDHLDALRAIALELGFAFRDRDNVVTRADVVAALAAHGISYRYYIGYNALLLHESLHVQQLWNGTIDKAEYFMLRSRTVEGAAGALARVVEEPAWNLQEELHLAVAEHPVGGYLTLSPIGDELDRRVRAANVLEHNRDAYLDIAEGVRAGEGLYPGRRFPGRRFPGRRFPGEILA